MAELSLRADSVRINPDIATSRRNVLAAIGIASVVVPAAALASPGAKVDAEFWRLHAEHKRCEAAWDADPDRSEPNWEWHLEIIDGALSAMLACPVSTVSAVLEKLEACEWQSFALDRAPGDSLDAIRADLVRMAKREA